MSTIEEMFALAWKARKHAQACLSKFRVGAAIRTVQGVAYTGCNIETETAKICLCAEVCALYKALSEGETRFDAVVVVAKKDGGIVPCGHCRQVLSQFAPGIEVHADNGAGVRKSWNLGDLLPETYRLDE